MVNCGCGILVRDYYSCSLHREEDITKRLWSIFHLLFIVVVKIPHNASEGRLIKTFIDYS